MTCSPPVFRIQVDKYTSCTHRSIAQKKKHHSCCAPGSGQEHGRVTHGHRLPALPTSAGHPAAVSAGHQQESGQHGHQGCRRRRCGTGDGSRRTGDLLAGLHLRGVLGAGQALVALVAGVGEEARRVLAVEVDVAEHGGGAGGGDVVDVVGVGAREVLERPAAQRRLVQRALALARDDRVVGVLEAHRAICNRGAAIRSRCLVRRPGRQGSRAEQSRRRDAMHLPSHLSWPAAGSGRWRRAHAPAARHLHPRWC